MFKWLSGGEAAQVGVALADDFILHSESGSGARRREGRSSPNQDLQKFLQKFLQRVDRQTSALKLNVFRSASLANSFKWRLLEKGIEQGLVDELTQSLVLRLTTRIGSAAQPQPLATAAQRRNLDRALLVDLGDAPALDDRAHGQFPLKRGHRGRGTRSRCGPRRP